MSGNDSFAPIDWIVDHPDRDSRKKNTRALVQDLDCSALLPLFSALCVAFPARSFQFLGNVSTADVLRNVIVGLLSDLSGEALAPYLPHVRDLEQKRIDGLRDSAENVARMLRDAQNNGKVLCIDERGSRAVVIGVDPADGTLQIAVPSMPHFSYPGDCPMLTVKQRRETMKIGGFSGNRGRHHYALGIRRGSRDILALERYPRGKGVAYHAVPAPSEKIRFGKYTAIVVTEPSPLE